MSLMSYNGGTVMAMTGKECVAIASDLRLGEQHVALATDFKKVYKIHDHLYVGFAGLATDCQTLANLFKFKHNLYKLKEERCIKPTTFAQLVSSTLYEKRFGPYYVEPVIAGIEPDGTPYISTTDMVGALSLEGNYAVAGATPQTVLGLCESMFKPDMEPDELFEVISQCMLSGVDRTPGSGFGAIVHIMTKDSIITKMLRGRSD